jgi:hypothetical protein
MKMKRIREKLNPPQSFFSKQWSFGSAGATSARLRSGSGKWIFSPS